MPITAYQPKCDQCGDVFEDEDIGQVVMTDQAACLRLAEDYGWLQGRGGQLTCPSCSSA